LLIRDCSCFFSDCVRCTRRTVRYVPCVSATVSGHGGVVSLSVRVLRLASCVYGRETACPCVASTFARAVERDRYLSRSTADFFSQFAPVHAPVTLLELGVSTPHTAGQISNASQSTKIHSLTIACPHAPSLEASQLGVSTFDPVIVDEHRRAALCAAPPGARVAVSVWK
jgi:hypothetical protein